MKYILTLCIYALAAMPLAAQTDVVLTAPDVKGYPVNRVLFRLVEDGNLITDIDTTRLRILEEGIELPFTVNCPAQIARSASVGIGLERSLDNNFGTAKQAALNFIRAMQFTDVPNNAAFWAFATPIDRVVDVVRDSLRLYNAINGTDEATILFNGTPLWETMFRAVEDIVEFGTEPTRAIVFFTDGRNNTAYFNTTREEVITRALTDGVRIYAVAVNATAANRDALEDMCRRTGGIMRLVTDPNAVQDIYADLIRPSIADYWCILEYRSPLCPNGSSRNITVEYNFPSVGVKDETVGYSAPYREAQLTKLNFYASPRRVRFEAGDTLRAAFGVYLQAPALLSDMRIQIQHPGLLAIGAAEILEGLQGWGVIVQPVPSFTTLELTPPADVVADSGSQRWFRLMFVAQTSGTVEFLPSLVFDKTQCLVMLQHQVAPAYRVQLDTVLAAWRGETDMPFRIEGQIPPEGVQRVAAEFRLDEEELMLLPNGTSAVFNLTPNWRVVQEQRTSDAGEGVLRLELAGPPIDAAGQLFALRMRVQDGAEYLNAVETRAVIVNAFAVEGITAAGSGLVVIRDSCRNNIGVTQQGLAVRGPAPNPAGEIAVFDLTASEPMDVTVDVYNALGVQACERIHRILPEGNTQVVLPLRRYEEGVYLVRFGTDKGAVTIRMIVAR